MKLPSDILCNQSITSQTCSHESRSHPKSKTYAWGMDSLPQLRPDSSQRLGRHVWLVAAILDGTSLQDSTTRLHPSGDLHRVLPDNIYPSAPPWKNLQIEEFVLWMYQEFIEELALEGAHMPPGLPPCSTAPSPSWVHRTPTHRQTSLIRQRTSLKSISWERF